MSLLVQDLTGLRRSTVSGLNTGTTFVANSLITGVGVNILRSRVNGQPLTSRANGQYLTSRAA